MGQVLVAHPVFVRGRDGDLHAAFYRAHNKRGRKVCSLAYVRKFKPFQLALFLPYGVKVAKRLQGAEITVV